MNKITLGKTNLVIEKNGFGCLPIQRISEQDAVKLLHKAYDGGINFFDTARAYSDSEQKVGAAFSSMRDKIVLATKTGAQTAEEFWKDLETSLRTLKTDYIDIYQFHNPAFCPKPGGADGLYDAALEAKKQGKLVGWSSSKFPCELAEAFDLNVMYPENQAAGIAAQRDGEIMCQAAEDLGFDNDICGYARISLAYAAGKRASRKFDPETLEFIIDPNSGKPLKDENGKVVIDPETGKPKKDPKTQVPYTVLDDIHEIEALPETTEKEIAYKNFRREAIKPYKQMRIPQPDFVLCCNNICNCMTKWYENIARMCNIPLIMVDIPYNNTVEVSDSAVKYVRAQFDNAIHELEKLTGKKFDEKKFELACKHANRTAQNWLKVCDFLQYKPAPMSGFDLFNHMADVVTARGKEAAADAFELLSKDLQKNIEEGTSTLPFPEQYRVMFEGIPCWPKLPNLFKPLKENGINVTAVVYAPAFGFVYNNMDEMARAYYKAPNSVCIEQGVAWREGICRDNKVDGVLVHYNRSCKPWSGYMAEMQRRFTADLGVPCAGFDGDQADPRNFNEAQYTTRVQGLVEAMEANKKD